MSIKRYRRSIVTTAIGLTFATTLAGASAASANGGTPDCVAQYVHDLHADGSITGGQLLGQPPDGLAHVLQPLGGALQIQATAPHDEACPFTYP